VAGDGTLTRQKLPLARLSCLGCGFSSVNGLR
jgi:hypothetical protein